MPIKCLAKKIFGLADCKTLASSLFLDALAAIRILVRANGCFASIRVIIDGGDRPAQLQAHS